MRWDAVRELARKDVRLVRRSRALFVPLVALPLVMLVLLPVGMAIIPALGANDPRGVEELQRLLAGLPAQATAALGDGPLAERWMRLVHTQLWPPMFLIVPLMVASVIAADAFAGERERKTLEALLYTPLTDAELLAAKVLAAWLPAMAVSVAGFAVYLAAINGLAVPLTGRALPPTVPWLLLVLWVAPAVAAMGLSAMVLISLRVRGTQEAMQLGGLLVLPVAGLVIAPVKGAVMLSATLVFAVGAVAWLLAAVTMVYAARSFRRTSLVTRL